MDIISAFKEEIGENKVLVGEDLKLRYNHIWTMNKPLQAKAYLLPDSTRDVARICEMCYAYGQAMVVFGGLTNLVGATQTTPEEVVISLERLNKIEDLDLQNRTMTVQSGVILETIQNHAQEAKLFFPLNFGAKGSAQIGGCIATNAGGIRVLKYGMTRQQVLGLEVVLPDGRIISSLKKMVKDNSGYDLKQLFIGAEGTLGIVTKAVLKLQEAPASRNSAFVALNSFNQVIDFLKFIEKGLGGQLSAFELLEQSSYQTLVGEDTPWRPPLPTTYNYYVLIEALGAQQERDKEVMETLLEQAVLEELVADGVMAHTASDLQWFWSIREDVGILSKKCPVDQHFDVSLPLKHMEEYIQKVKNELADLPGVTHCFVFGHLADGNMHFVVGKTTDDDELKEEINKTVYLPLRRFRGSISAEHGVGLHKKKYLNLCRNYEERSLMRKLKRTFDYRNLLNRGRIFD